MAKRGIAGIMTRAFGGRDHAATVRGREMIAPHFVRIHLHSPTLLRDFDVAPASWARLWFPDLARPDFEHQRGYTFVEADPETGEFSIDFVLHEPAGPASHWARHAAIGDTLSVTPLGSTQFDVPAELPAGYLVIGDAASIPAIRWVVSEVPAEVPIELYLEEHVPADRQVPVPGHPRMRTHWVTRTSASSLADAIERRDWTGWYAWVTPEAGSLKALRAPLRDEFGFAKSGRHLQAYWTEGRVMGKERGAEERAGERPEIA